MSASTEPPVETLVEPIAPGGSTVPAPPARRRRSRIDIALLLAAMIAIGGAAFGAGRLTAPTAAANAAQDCGPGGGGSGAPGASGQPEPANPSGNTNQ